MIDSSLLQKYSLFDGLEQDQIDNLLSRMAEETYDAGTDIIAEGSQNCKIYFILEGRVAATSSGIILQELGEGSFFGEMEVLDVLPSAATIKALEPTRVIILSIDTLGEIYDADLKVYSFIIMNLARDLSRKLRRLDVMYIKDSPVMDWS
ncbi:MAG: cyclic nucleotide-binding domain-containing protein [Treponema sp.]|nr:cyclic nucleotide-binding domain-containing protein [Treponema sp.]